MAENPDADEQENEAYGNTRPGVRFAFRSHRIFHCKNRPFAFTRGLPHRWATLCWACFTIAVYRQLTVSLA